MSRPESTSTDNQCLRLLSHWLTTGHGLNRYEADRLLNVCHLAARVQDLEAMGCVFSKADETAHDLLGRPHAGIRRYWLKSAPLRLLQRVARREGSQ